MTTSKNKLSVHVNIKITDSALQAIVFHAKQIAEKNVKGVYRLDTADQLSAMVTRFLEEKDFDSYVQNIDNYPLFSG